MFTMSFIRYERYKPGNQGHDYVVPLRVEKTCDHNGHWWVSRLTELPWPIPSIERDNEAQQAAEDGYLAYRHLVNTRGALFAAPLVRSSTSGNIQPVLQEPHNAPVVGACLQLDYKTWSELHE